MTLHQLPEQNHSQCEYGDPNRKELGPQQRALESFSPRQRLHPSVLQSVHAGVFLHPSVPAGHDLMALDYIESIQALHRPKNSEVGVVGPVRLFLSEEVSLNPLGHLVQLVLEVLTRR